VIPYDSLEKEGIYGTGDNINNGALERGTIGDSPREREAVYTVYT
jgi:hypothetical protein